MERFTIVIIDDSDLAISVIKAAIAGDPQFEVIESATTVDDAELACAAFAPDLITLDLNLTGGEGLDNLLRLQRISRAAIVIVSASTYDGAPITQELLACGASACFDKRKVLLQAPAFLETLRSAVLGNA